MTGRTVGRWSVAFLVGAIALGGVADSLWAQTGTGDLGVISGQSGMAARPIMIAGDAALVPLAQRAFGLHGGFRLAPASEATAVIRLSAVGNGVRVVVETGRPPQPTFSVQFPGPDSAQPLERGADAAVQHLLGKPGFFASRLAFVARRGGAATPDVYAGDLLFQRILQVSSTRAEVVSPTISPNGQDVVFTSYYRGFPEILGFNLANRSSRSIAAFKGNNSGATYSPTGDRLAMVLSPGGNAELFIGSPAGGGFRRLTTSRSLEADPSWSPDGTELTFVSDSLGRPQIFVMNAAGGGIRRLPTNISGYCAEPDWNPRDRNQIVFTIASGSQFKLALWSFTTNAAEPLSMPGAFDAVHPAWLADGRHVVYTERTARARRLAVYDTVTRRRTGYLHSDNWGMTWQASPTR